MQPQMIAKDFPDLPADLIETLRFDLIGERIKLSAQDAAVIAESADSITVRFETRFRPSLALETVNQADSEGRTAEWLSSTFGHRFIRAEATDNHLLITIKR